MATPAPVFPAAVATDAQLKVAANQIVTTLRVGANSGDTILFVQSTAGFPANCLVSIDNEIIAVASTGANNTLNVASGGRGFDATMAAAHSAGVKVSLLIVAWHHNVLSTEVKAIESFLGPNGQNIASISGNQVWAQTYQFSQAPGGSLVPGNNSITLSPVPAGVSGADGQHYLYVSGGTGAPEAALITGGTAVGGQPSGQLIINCANGHTGAWTLASASGGIKEAINANNGQGTVNLPNGVLTLYAPLVIPTTVCIHGQGSTSNSATVLSTRIVAAAGVSPGIIVADNLGSATKQGIGTHSNYSLWGPNTGTGLLIGGDPNGVYCPSTWFGSWTRYVDISIGYFATALEIYNANFVSFHRCGISGLTRGLVIPAGGGVSNLGNQPLGFYDCTITVPSGIAVQMDNSTFTTSSLFFCGGQVSGTITGLALDWQSFGCHYEPNNPNDPIVAMTGTQSGVLKIFGGLMSTHGPSTPFHIQMNGSAYYVLMVDGVTIQCDGGTTVPMFIDFETSAGGMMTLRNIFVNQAGTFTNLYKVGGSALNALQLSISLNQGTAPVNINAAANLVFPNGNFPNRGLTVIQGASVGGSGITSVSGSLIYGQSGVIVCLAGQTFTAGATIGSTITMIPMVPYMYYFDGTKIQIK